LFTVFARHRQGLAVKKALNSTHNLVKMDEKSMSALLNAAVNTGLPTLPPKWLLRPAGEVGKSYKTL
jgi:hypothetical protein